MSDDQHFLQKVRELLASARNHVEEAASYADGIEDPRLRREARDLVDRFGETLP